MEKVKICRQGFCPSCGSEDLNYDSPEFYAESITYNFSCNNCGVSGIEEYSMRFVGSSYYKNGKTFYVNEGDKLNEN
jgi:hypothetical protein